MSAQQIEVRLVSDKTTSKTVGSGGLLNTHVQFETTLKGVFDKRCECEHCGEEFVYPMRRTAEGEGLAIAGTYQSRAKQASWDKAFAKLVRTFGSQCDPVPCPECGRYQAAMSRRMYLEEHGNPRKSSNKLVLAGAGAVAAGLGCGVLTLAVRDGSAAPSEGSLVTLAVTVGVFAIGLILITVGIVRVMRSERRSADYDPHPESTREERLRLARVSGAVTADEYRAAKKMGHILQHPSERVDTCTAYDFGPPTRQDVPPPPGDTKNPFDFV